METRLSGWWLSWGGCALLLLACLAVEHGPKCGVDQYEQHERCCKKCPPGQKVETECSGESDTVCQDCESGRFQAGWTKAMQCTPHADCHQYAGLVVHMGGNAQRNVVCRCRNGTHCYGQECESCQPNSACGPGEGVRQEAVRKKILSRRQRGHGHRMSFVVKKPGGPTHWPYCCCCCSLLLCSWWALLFLLSERGETWDKQPAEEDDEECSASPIQETLLGGQPVAQEDGKDSRLAQQEQV
ncbi:tumor necrosis factor receptor superfamily member 5 isoform X3 [Elgaria multicarinata webbii]|uniref:tumor necrosis factor receptor superfamily member 5 isoform X3 n=1 Tax=Elgaria multicarinata webbii TaxID=159646 RepID=UPI002FCD275F